MWGVKCTVMCAACANVREIVCGCGGISTVVIQSDAVACSVP